MNERLERALRMTKERVILSCDTCGFATTVPSSVFTPALVGSDCPQCKSNMTGCVRLRHTGRLLFIRAGIAVTYHEETCPAEKFVTCSSVTRRAARREIRDMLFRDQAKPTKAEMDAVRAEWK